MKIRSISRNFPQQGSDLFNSPSCSCVWMENAGTFPRHEIGKIFVDIWWYLPEVYTFGGKSEIHEIFRNKCEKKSISHRDFDQKIEKNLLKIFKILLILDENAQNFAGWLLIFSCSIEISHQILMSMHFPLNSIRFSPTISRMPFSIVLLYLGYFWALFIDFSIR